MHFVIIGPGALGCLLTAFLHAGKQSDDSITVLDYNAQRAAHISENGVCYFRDRERRDIDVCAFSAPEKIGDADVIFLCVKSYDIGATLEFSKHLLQRSSLLVFMQNGISHLRCAARTYGAVAAFGTTTEGATSLGPGQVRHAGSGTTHLGFLQQTGRKQHTMLDGAAKRLAQGGAAAACTDAILEKIWNKLFINVGINALTVIHDCLNGDLINNPAAREQMEGALNEALHVAEAENVSSRATVDDILEVCRATGANVSSMLQDVRHGRKTEIDAINGAIVALAERHGISTPVNKALVSQVREKEKRERRQ